MSALFWVVVGMALLWLACDILWIREFFEPPSPGVPPDQYMFERTWLVIFMIGGLFTWAALVFHALFAPIPPDDLEK